MPSETVFQPLTIESKPRKQDLSLILEKATMLAWLRFESEEQLSRQMGVPDAGRSDSGRPWWQYGILVRPHAYTHTHARTHAHAHARTHISLACQCLKCIVVHPLIARQSMSLNNCQGLLAMWANLYALNGGCLFFG